MRALVLVCLGIAALGCSEPVEFPMGFYEVDFSAYRAELASTQGDLDTDQAWEDRLKRLELVLGTEGRGSLTAADGRTTHLQWTRSGDRISLKFLTPNIANPNLYLLVKKGPPEALWLMTPEGGSPMPLRSRN